jgi:hypothetical protein
LLRLHRRLSPALTKQLRFLSKTGPRAQFFVSETELSSQATRNLPELTPESAALLDRVIDVTDRLPRTGQLLTVTEQMLGVGESVAGRVRWTPETGQLGGLDLLWLSATVPPRLDAGPIDFTGGHISE